MNHSRTPIDREPMTRLPSAILLTRMRTRLVAMMGPSAASARKALAEVEAGEGAVVLDGVVLAQVDEG